MISLFAGNIYVQVNRNMTSRLQIGNVGKVECEAENIDMSVTSMKSAFGVSPPKIISFQCLQGQPGQGNGECATLSRLAGDSDIPTVGSRYRASQAESQTDTGF